MDNRRQTRAPPARTSETHCGLTTQISHARRTPSTRPRARYAGNGIFTSTLVNCGRLGELRRYLQGWAGYFSLAAQLKLFDKLDQWIRRQAFRHAKSRKGPWHMAKTIASGVGMTNAWLQDQGLVSLKSLWAKLAPPRRTA